jgi:uncharacterized iron-regulated membrane protein
MLRRIFFWFHLGLGLAAGVFIFVMCLTGAALTFEKDLIAWAERDARRIAPPAAGAARLSLAVLLEHARAATPALRVLNLTVSSDPRDAVALAAPGNRTYCVDPYTGAVREAQAPRMRAFMQAMRDWHLRLNFKPTPGAPTLGTRLNSAANLVFVLLGLSGLVLWWPRSWSRRALAPALWLVRGARGRARDWNWHNAIGFWSVPLLLVLAGTGVVLSYRWAGDLVFVLAGEPPPAPPAGARPAPATAAPPPATSGGPAATATRAPGLEPDALLAAVRRARPDAAAITLRFTPALGAPRGAGAPASFTAVVKASHPWPPFSSDTLTLDAATGDVLKTDTFAAQSAGTRARRWIRLLHSAEALGPFVAALSGLACLGGCVLVYTGFALAWRRFFGRGHNDA